MRFASNRSPGLPSVSNRICIASGATRCQLPKDPYVWGVHAFASSFVCMPGLGTYLASLRVFLPLLTIDEYPLPPPSSSYTPATSCSKLQCVHVHQSVFFQVRVSGFAHWHQVFCRLLRPHFTSLTGVPIPLQKASLKGLSSHTRGFILRERSPHYSYDVSELPATLLANPCPMAHSPMEETRTTNGSRKLTRASKPKARTGCLTCKYVYFCRGDFETVLTTIGYDT